MSKASELPIVPNDQYGNTKAVVTNYTNHNSKVSMQLPMDVIKDAKDATNACNSAVTSAQHVIDVADGLITGTNPQTINI